MASASAQVAQHFQKTSVRDPHVTDTVDHDGSKPTPPRRHRCSAIDHSSRHTRIHSSGSIRNFDTNQKFSRGFESCVPIWQKLESSFEKYGLSRREVNRTIVAPPFCKRLHPRCTSPSIEKTTRVDSGNQQSTRAVVQASSRSLQSSCRLRTTGETVHAQTIAPLLSRCYTETIVSCLRSDPDAALATADRRVFTFSSVAMHSGKERRTVMAMDRVDAYLEAHRGDFEEQLKALIRIPSVSAQPDHDADTRRAATSGPRRPGGHGAQDRADRDQGPPHRLCRMAGRPGKPTLLVYGHYDVQPPEPLEPWLSPPFEPTVRNGNLYARGATDDKGQMFTHLKAAEAWLKTSGRLPVNVKFVIEGEEEVGGANLEAYVAEQAKRLACDYAVISDSSQFAPGQPAITYGLKGLAYFELSVQGANRDLHSGNLRRRRRQPAQRPGHDPRQLEGSRRQDPDRRLLRRRQAARGLGAGRVRQARLFGGRVSGRSRACRAWRARPATRRSNASGPGRPATSTASSAVMPAPAPRPCCPARPAPSSASAWFPTRIPRPSSGSSASTSPGSARRA